MVERIPEPRGGRVIIIQPVVPAYRMPLFERMHGVLGERLQVFASPLRHGRELKFAKDGQPWLYSLGPTRPILPGIYWQRGVAAIRPARGDTVVVSGAPRSLSNLVVLLRSRFAGAATLWWGHYRSAGSRSWRVRLRLLLMRMAGTVVFYTDEEVERYIKSGGARDRRRLFAVNNGIETKDITRLRAPYEPTARGPHILFIGRITPKARFGLLIGALAMPQCRDVVLHVVGGGDEEAALRSKAEATGIAERIRWHGPTTDEGEIAAIANRCALFVYPGAVGLSVIHAFAYGLPAIIHDERWLHMPEVAAFTEGVNGFTFRPDDAASLSRTIATALGDPDRLKAMSATAIETTTRSYNVADMAARLLNAIDVEYLTRYAEAAR